MNDDATGERRPEDASTIDYSQQTVDVSGAVSLDSVDAATFDASGSCTVDGDVVARRVDSSGSTTVAGDLVAERVDSSGSLQVDGDVRALEVDSSGSTTVGGDLEADRVASAGTSRVHGETRVDSIESSGRLELADAVVDTLDSSGSVTLGDLRARDVAIDGTVDADRLDADSLAIELADDATVGTIVADDVEVTPGTDGGLLDRLVGGSASRLTVDRVAGDEIHLEHTVAATVEGGTVRLGPGCAVDVVRADDLEVHDDASVDRREAR